MPIEPPDSWHGGRLCGDCSGEFASYPQARNVGTTREVGVGAGRARRCE